MKHVKISGILHHFNQGEGFKLTFLDLQDAQEGKQLIIKMFEDKGWIVTNRRDTYYEKE